MASNLLLVVATSQHFCVVEDQHMTENDPDRPITFNDAAKYLPENCRPCYATWWRWWRKGVKGVRLTTLMCGGRRFTTPRFVEEFFAKVTAAANGEPLPVRTLRQREQAMAQAEKELTKKRGRTRTAL